MEPKNLVMTLKTKMKAQLLRKELFLVGAWNLSKEIIRKSRDMTISRL